MITTTGIDRIRRLTANVEVLQEHGCTVSDAFNRTRERIEQFRQIESEERSRELSDIVLDLDNDAERIRDAYTAALAASTASSVNKAEVRNEVLDNLAAALATAYRPSAAANYDMVAAKFNKAAAAFTKAHKTVPATTDAATLVTADAATRKAWADAQAAGPELDALVKALALAAELAGMGSYERKSGLIGVSVNAEGCHRRRIWEAWDEPLKWAALINEGASIEAPDLDDVAHYREPKPLETRWEQGDIGHRQVTHDPEDGVPAGIPTADLESQLENEQAWKN